MRIAIIADAYPPLRNSAAVQLQDLAQEFLRLGHQPTVLVASSEIDQPWLRKDVAGVDVLRLKAPRTRDVNHVRRTIGEFLMPFSMLRNLRKSPLANQRWDGVVWYSPTIFLGPIAKSLKQSSACRSYLIIRDIFPEWAVNMDLMGRGLPYYFFKTIEKFQYSVADVIGVQTVANVAYLSQCVKRSGRQVEVLQNWLAAAPNIGCSISISESALAGRKVFVYAGNMGLAQGMDIFLNLAESLRTRTDIGFLFVGRGSEVQRLRLDAAKRGLDNVVFFSEIDPSEIPGLYAQCHAGIVALDLRHKTHNIPGKFLSYMQSGLPVLASINPGNDLEGLINNERVGKACVEASVDTLRSLTEQLVSEIEEDADIPLRCKALAARLFMPETAVRQILHTFAYP